MTISPDDDGLGSRAPTSSGRLPQELAPNVDDLGFASTPPVLTGASIVTPGDWIELDLDPATRHKSIGRAVRQAIARSPSLAPDAIGLIAMLDRTTSLAAKATAFYCASRVIEDATQVIVATVLMQVCRSPAPPAHGSPSLSVGERCAALREVFSKDPDWAGAHTRVVELRFVGTAVRLHVDAPGIVVQYLVPLRGGFAHAVLTFTCPCPPYARVMTELFDTMAQSLELHY